MTALVAGIDVGNATTEVVLARQLQAGLEVVAADRAPTRRVKGTPESIAGAAALVRRMERRHGVRVERAVVAPLRPVQVSSASLPEELPDTGRFRVVARGSATAGGHGFGSGRPVRFGSSLPDDAAAVVVVPSGVRYDQVAAGLAAPASSGRIAAVLLEDDEAVLVANRLPVTVPVVDEVSPSSVLSADVVAVEVPPDGRPLQLLTDPLKLASALGLGSEEVGAAAALAGLLFDAPNAVVAVGGDPGGPSARPVAWIEVAGRRLPFAEGHERVRAGGVGDAQAYAVPPEAERRAVDDLWTVDLAAVAEAVQARRSGSGERPVGLAAMHVGAGLSDPSEGLVELLGVPVALAHSEAGAARDGALTTPAAPEDAVVVDLGGGTIDVVAVDRAAVAAGAGDLLTAAVASLTGGSTAAAEWVKRGPCQRIESPQVVLGEDGTRGFLEPAAPPDTLGQLVVRGPAGLLAFSRTMAPGEWRALRLRLKTDLIGGNVARGLRALESTPSAVVVVGGSAGDDEVLAAVTGALPPGTAVGRGSVGGVLGHRYAVAYGLVLEAARTGS